MEQIDGFPHFPVPVVATGWNSLKKKRIQGYNPQPVNIRKLEANEESLLWNVGRL